MRKLAGIIVLLLSVQLCTAATINVPSDQPTIQAGINAAYNGDTVLIAPGTYSGDGNIMLSTRKKAIVVRGSDGPDNTIIDCMDSIGFYIVNFESPYEFGNTIIEDLTIRDGRRAMVLSYAWPTLRNIKFINHSERGLSYEFFEQMIKETRSDLIHNCVFDSCYIGAISELGSVDPEFRNCTFSNCDRGVHKFYYAVFENCSFIDNYYGLLQDDWDIYSIDSCLFEGNHAGIVEGNSGFDITNTIFRNGGIAIMAGFSYGHFTTSNCIFEDMYGTVISGMREAEITDCIFRSNTGLVFYMDGVSIDEPSEGIIKNCQIYGNNNILTQKYFGDLKVNNSIIMNNTGGIEIQYPVDNQIIMDSCIYARNGEPLFFKTGYDSRLELNNCTVVENAGGGIYLDNTWGGPAQINNSIIALNTGYGIGVSNPDSIDQITISCSDFYSNFNGNYHYITDQTGLNGNISDNPLFCEGENPEYNIALSSPCAPANNSCGVLMGAGQVVDCQPGHTGTLTLHVPADYPTIQDAIDEAYEGDTVMIAAGTYTGEGNTDVRTNGKGIVVMGAGPDNTIIDCAGSRGFYMDYYSREDSTTVIEGLTIINGESGILFAYSTPMLINLRFVNNHRALHNETDEKNDEYTKDEFGIIYIRNCEFLNNTRSGLSFCGGWSSFFQIEDCVFSGNTLYGACLGWSLSANFKRCKFINNGVGLENFEGPNIPIYVDSCLFDSNDIGFEGNAIITNSEFKNGGIGIYGSAFFGTFFNAINCSFTGHTNVVFGSADSGFVSNCRIYDNHAGIAYCDSEEDELNFVFQNCTFDNNAYGMRFVSFGGGYTHFSLDNCLYINNGGPIAFWYTSICNGGFSLNNCTIANNDSSGVYCQLATNISCSINNCIISDNDGYGIDILQYGGGEVSINCSDNYGNIDGNYNGISDQTGLNGNISDNPLFCEEDTLKYNIALSSPCAPANNSCGVTMGAGAVVDCVPEYPPVAVISIDRSGSMFYTDPLGQSRLERAKTLAHSEIDKLLALDDPDYPGVYWVAVQYFNASGIVLSQDYTSSSSLLHDAIDNIPGPKHDTPLAAAMCQAHCLVSELDFPEKFVITFTDGLENESQNFDLCTVCDPCNDLIESGWNFDCDPNNPESCTEWQLCLAEQFSTTGVNLVHYFGEPINPFDKSKNYDGLEDMYFLKSAAEHSDGGFFYHSDLEIEGYLPGDANHDNLLNISDAVYLINFVFNGGEAPQPHEAGDYNLDGSVNVSDAVGIIRYVFAGE